MWSIPLIKKGWHVMRLYLIQLCYGNQIVLMPKSVCIPLCLWITMCEGALIYNTEYKVLIYLLLPLYSPLWGLLTIWATVVECVIVVLTCQVFKLQINPLCLSPWHRTETQGCITTGYYKATYNFFWLYLWNFEPDKIDLPKRERFSVQLTNILNFCCLVKITFHLAFR